MCTGSLNLCNSPVTSCDLSVVLQVSPPGMHMVFLPTKEDVRAPEADPKFRGETWPIATEAQARRALTPGPLVHLRAGLQGNNDAQI